MAKKSFDLIFLLIMASSPFYAPRCTVDMLCGHVTDVHDWQYATTSMSFKSKRMNAVDANHVSGIQQSKSKVPVYVDLYSASSYLHLMPSGMDHSFTCKLHHACI